jgi:hypothetical protein
MTSQEPVSRAMLFCTMGRTSGREADHEFDGAESLGNTLNQIAKGEFSWDGRRQTFLLIVAR